MRMKGRLALGGGFALAVAALGGALVGWVSWSGRRLRRRIRRAIADSRRPHA